MNVRYSLGISLKLHKELESLWFCHSWAKYWRCMMQWCLHYVWPPTVQVILLFWYIDVSNSLVAKGFSNVNFLFVWYDQVSEIILRANLLTRKNQDCRSCLSLSCILQTSWFKDSGAWNRINTLANCNHDEHDRIWN